MSIDNDKVTEIFCMADDFCRVYDRFVKVNGLAPKRAKSKRKYHRDGRLSDAEVITIMILFHLGGYKCLKHLYALTFPHCLNRQPDYLWLQIKNGVRNE